jgi:hypothetical protein
MRLPALFHLLILSFVFVFLACGASDEQSENFFQLAGFPYAVGARPGVFPRPGATRFFDNQPIRAKLNSNAAAEWLARDLLITHNGELRLGLELRYRSSIPEQMQLTFVGSAVFLELYATYVSNLPSGGGVTTHLYPVRITMLLSPIAVDHKDAQRGFITYKGIYPHPDTDIFEGRSLDYLALGFAWLRVYKTREGEYRYELMLSSGRSKPDKNCKVDTSYDKVLGSFDPIYLPFPESQMGIAYIQDEPDGIDPFTGFFDYVKWVKENVLVPKQ